MLVLRYKDLVQINLHYLSHDSREMSKVMPPGVQSLMIGTPGSYFIMLFYCISG